MNDTTCTAQNACTRPQPDPDERLTLSQAARIAPGGPSPNCVWRWCRRGVVARTGDRVRLQHVRIGGKLFTSARWLDEFGQRLADADAKYFEIGDQESGDERSAVSPSQRRRARKPPSSRRGEQGDDALRERIRAELEAEGL